jgi:CHAD domain-containing protein
MSEAAPRPDTGPADDAPVPGGVGLILQDRLGRTVRRLRDPDLDATSVVHEVRKDLKRIRALLRLAAERLPTRNAERRCAAAARALAELRDADAALETLARLRCRADAGDAAADLNDVEAWLIERRNAVAPGLPAPVASMVAAELEAVAGDLAGLPFGRLDDDSLDAGLARTTERSAAAFRRVVGKPRPTRFHALRKAVKRELHQRELAGRPFERMDRAMLKNLADMLGELQDLEVLRGLLKADGRWRGPVKRLARAARPEMEARALRLAAARYADVRL